MELSIHDVKLVTVSKITQNLGAIRVRTIKIYSKEGDFEITLFAAGADPLKFELRDNTQEL